MGMIDIRNLCTSFDGVPVLRDVNLTVEKGTTVVILGTSGAGKSVLLKSIIGLMTPDSGSIRIDGKEIIGMDSEELYAVRRRMGYLFQGAALYDSMSVRGNLEFALRHREALDEDEMGRKAEEQLRLVGLADVIDKMPSQLSGGMRKRIGLARALITQPEVMLYDEPTTGLDPATGREISELIQSLQQQHAMTSIAVTHDIACARTIADRVAILNTGIIRFEGALGAMEHADVEMVKQFFATA
jgi:phospholipid/cholesterol/gamma-HCH transport system ATP-binding protein